MSQGLSGVECVFTEVIQRTTPSQHPCFFFFPLLLSDFHTWAEVKIYTSVGFRVHESHLDFIPKYKCCIFLIKTANFILKMLEVTNFNRTLPPVLKESDQVAKAGKTSAWFQCNRSKKYACLFCIIEVFAFNLWRLSGFASQSKG